MAPSSNEGAQALRRAGAQIADSAQIADDCLIEATNIRIGEHARIEAGVRIQRQTGQHAFFIVSGITNNAKLVIDSLDACRLQIIPKEMIDEGGFAG